MLCVHVSHIHLSMSLNSVIHLLCIIQTLMNARLAHIIVNRTATTIQDHITALVEVDTNYLPMGSVKVRNIDNVCMCTIRSRVGNISIYLQ